jgi:hypothetical protein
MQPTSRPYRCTYGATCGGTLQVDRVRKAWNKAFCTAEVVEAVAADVNQPSGAAERVLNRDSVASWASTDAPAGFDAHSIYYDETRAAEFEDGELPEDAYQPYLSKAVAAQVSEMRCGCSIISPPDPTARAHTIEGSTTHAHGGSGRCRYMILSHTVTVCAVGACGGGVCCWEIRRRRQYWYQ